MSESGDPALIGRTIAAKFVVEKFLGGGAMGAVYRARQIALEKTVAIKVMHRAVAVDPSFAARFHREAKAASRLDHPNSMRVIDFGEEPDGLLYIAMEYLEGRDLFQLIQTEGEWETLHAKTCARIVDILMQALAAIAVAHDMGVIHRDLKPENIMVLRGKDDEGREADVVKVCDFGIAKITEKDDAPPAPGAPAGQKLTTQGLVVGTPEYMSPEQARGEKLDARTDIYSMGIILYQLLTGRVPFTADTALAIVLKHLTDPPEPPSKIWPEVPKALEAVCLKAIAKPREDRFQSARDMRAALRAALEVQTAKTQAHAIAHAATMEMPLDAIVGAPQAGAASAPALPPAPAVVGGGAGAAGGTMPASLPSKPLEGGEPAGTPLVAAASAEAAPSRRSSSLPLVAGVLVGAGVLGAIAFGYSRTKHATDVHPTEPTTTVATTGTAQATATPTSPLKSPASAAQVATGAPSIAPVPELMDRPSLKVIPKGPQHHGNGAASPEGPSNGGAANGAQPGAPSPGPAEPPASPASTPPSSPPATPPAAPSPATPPPPPEPAVPAFNPATCRAQIGGVSSNGSASAKDLTLNGTQGAWTSCAKNGVRERPSGPIAAKVTIQFSDNRAFRGATCAGCPPAVAACIAQTTRPTVSVNFKGGDVTGDPAFTVAVTFTCD